MNTLHLKYAVEVERTGSISKAAENLYMNQPHLSKIIRELEDTIGIPIFNRTSKGVIPTKKGAKFLMHAKNILAQMEEMEALNQTKKDNGLTFDIAVPRASYISYAFTEFMKSLNLEEPISVDYRETNSVRAIKNVSSCENNLAIIRYQTVNEKYFLNQLKEKHLEHKMIWEFEYLLLMSRKHPLGKKDNVDYSDLGDYIEISHGDITIPTMSPAKAQPWHKSQEKKRRITLYERGSQFEILDRIPTTYIWASPVPEEVLDRFSLVQKKCNMVKYKYKDVLIYRKGYRLRQEDESFIEQLSQTTQDLAQ